MCDYKEKGRKKMKYLQNLHTHCTYCDGKDTPEEMIAYALQKGFDSLGFSSHSYAYYSNYGLITREKNAEYRKVIPELKKKYADRIKIYMGIEYEMYCEEDQTGYDYLIGAVHYLKHPDGWVDFDRGGDWVQDLIKKFYGGDGLKFAKAYYEAMADMPNWGKFDIIAHFDIITKNIETHALFDTESKAYLDAALGAMEALRGKIPLFEVNTGAISRGYRTSPYPTVTLLKHFKEMGFNAIISSDCHDGRYLDCHFNESAELLKECGFKEKFVLTDEGFVPAEL